MFNNLRASFTENLPWPLRHLHRGLHMEMAKMQDQMKTLPPAPRKPEKAEKSEKQGQADQDHEEPEKRKVILKEAEHKMPAGHGQRGGQALLPGPPPLWFQGIFQTQPRPLLRPPLQQQMQQIQIQLQQQHRSLDLGPTHPPDPEVSGLGLVRARVFWLTCARAHWFPIGSFIKLSTPLRSTKPWSPFYFSI